MKQKALKTLLPYNIQFFADDGNGGEPGGDNNGGDNAGNDGGDNGTGDNDDAGDNGGGTGAQKTVEEQLAEALAKTKMLEKKLDKTNKKLTDTEQKYNDVLTDAQKTKLEEAERKAEEAEELDRLRKENAVTKFEKNFLALGYPEDLAAEAAEAQYDNDASTLMRIQSEFLTLHDKQKEAEWQKRRPLPKSGGDEEETDITLEQLNRMPYLKQVEFKKAHPEAYKQLTGGN